MVPFLEERYQIFRIFNPSRSLGRLLQVKRQACMYFTLPASWRPVRLFRAFGLPWTILIYHIKS